MRTPTHNRVSVPFSAQARGYRHTPATCPLPKRGTGALPARATGSRRAPPARPPSAGPAPAPRRAHPRRKPGSGPLPRQTMTEGGQPGGRGMAAASAPPPPFPGSAAGPGVRAARGRASPAPCPHRTAPRRPLLPPPPRAGRSGRRRSGVRGSPLRAALPRRAQSGRSRGVSGEELSESAAGPGRGSPGGRAG